jgi:HEAT repeat protein
MDTNQKCKKHITPAKLPQRTLPILIREDRMFRSMVDTLMGLGKGSEFEEDNSENLTLAMLEYGFTNADDITMLLAASWLVGRCQPEAADGEAALKKLAADFIAPLEVGRLDVMMQPYIESVMAHVLLGESAADAREKLLPLVTDFASPNSASYLAAFYLAQMGEPAGYGALLASLHGTNEHYRLMAARHLIGFAPYDGQPSGGKIINTADKLTQCLKDNSVYVRSEAPYLLAEAKVPNLKELLQPVAKNDADLNVRQIAEDVLEYL